MFAVFIVRRCVLLFVCFLLVVCWLLCADVVVGRVLVVACCLLFVVVRCLVPVVRVLLGGVSCVLVVVC